MKAICLPTTTCASELSESAESLAVPAARLAEALDQAVRDFLVVGTKADRLSGNQRTMALAHLTRDLELDELLLCSAKTGLGLTELWSRLLSLGNDRAEAGLP